MRNLLGYLGGINRELSGMESCIDHHYNILLNGQNCKEAKFTGGEVSSIQLILPYVQWK